jgi:hypothetical protein
MHPDSSDVVPCKPSEPAFESSPALRWRPPNLGSTGTAHTFVSPTAITTFAPQSPLFHCTVIHCCALVVPLRSSVTRVTCALCAGPRDHGHPTIATKLKIIMQGRSRCRLDRSHKSGILPTASRNQVAATHGLRITGVVGHGVPTADRIKA